MGGAAIPYAMSFYAKGLEGYIDNPDAGWKGRGVWTPRGPISVMRAPFEGNGRQAIEKKLGITGTPDQPADALASCTVTLGVAKRISPAAKASISRRSARRCR